MIPVCGIPTLVALTAYVIAGMVLSSRMLKHGKDGRPLGFAIFQKESYTPEGQRLFKLFKLGWVYGSLPVAFLLAITGGLLCLLTGWTPAAP